MDFNLQNSVHTLELETVYTVVTEDGVIVDIKAMISLEVNHETSGAETDLPRKDGINIHITNTSPIHIAHTTTMSFIFTSTKFRIEARRLAKLLGQIETEALLIELVVVAASVGAGRLISTGEVSVEPEGSADFPSTKTVLKYRDSLVEAVDLHAEGVEFILEFHDELLEELEVLLAGLFSVYGHERARHYGRHLVTGRGLCTLECASRPRRVRPCGQFRRGV